MNSITYVFFACALFVTRSIAVSPQNVIYWGQGDEQDLKNYCMDDTYDIFVLGFTFLWPLAPGDSVYPGMNLAGHCETTFPGHPYLLNCPDVASDIAYCQAQGKKVFMSLGGAVGQYGFTSDAQAQSFGNMIWNLFLGGTNALRPFGNVILDGIDLDIEGGSTTGYAAFITSLRSHFVGASKPYYISSAPQCVYPDGWLGPGSNTAFQNGWFDYVWIQFYNNYCGLDHYPSQFNFNTWANWASTISVNPNVQLFIGAPGSASAAGSGYVNANTLKTIATAVQAQYPNHFGGIMLWDAGHAENNNNFGASVKSFLKNFPGYIGSGGSSSSSTSSTTQAAAVTTKAVTTSKVTTHAAAATTKAMTTRKVTTQAAAATTNKLTTGKMTTNKLTTGMPAVTTKKLTTAPVPSVSFTSGNQAVTTRKITTNKEITSHKGTSGVMSTTGLISATTGQAQTPSGPCVDGHMTCATSESYRTCARGSWGPEQHCQVGLTCSPSGVYIYCV